MSCDDINKINPDVSKDKTHPAYWAPIKKPCNAKDQCRWSTKNNKCGDINTNNPPPTTLAGTTFPQTTIAGTTLAGTTITPTTLAGTTSPQTTLAGTTSPQTTLGTGLLFKPTSPE